jgi:hypothetical protein
MNCAIPVVCESHFAARFLRLAKDVHQIGGDLIPAIQTNEADSVTLYHANRSGRLEGRDLRHV